MSIHELSLVTFGADPYATVNGTTLTTNQVDELIEKFAKQMEDFIMTKEDNIVESLKEENLELSQKIKDLEAELEQQKTDFKVIEDDLKVAHKEEILTLTQEKDALQAKVEEMTEELSVFRAQAKAEAEQQLAAKKEKLAELAKAFDSEDLLEDDMSEELIDKQIAMLERVADKVNQPVVPEFTGTEQPHGEVKDEEPREAFSGVSKYFGIAHAKIEKGD